MYMDLVFGLIILVLFLTPVATPKGKWFWVSTVILAGLLAYLWADHFYYTSKPDYDYGNGAGAALGETLALIVTGSFLGGLFVRFCIWIWIGKDAGK